MRTREDVRRVAELAASGAGAGEIARRTGVPATTVARWLSGGAPRRPSPGAATCPACGHAEHAPDEPAYAYLLGLYLGDGHIVEHPRAHRLALFLDARYPGIVAGAAEAVQRIVPGNRVSLRESRGCVAVQCYSRQWPCLLPQHGAGLKHEREIRLHEWQRAVTGRHPRELVRGLIHSDGSRFLNRVRSRGRAYAYPRYMFANESADIRGIFCEHLDLLGIPWRPAGRRNISVARREAVAALDAFVGPKA